MVEQLDRIGSATASLSAELDEICLEDLDRMTKARMFAHEVNNLVVGISGRAERARQSGDAAMTQQALEIAADLGVQIRGLCSAFLDEFELGTGYVEHSQVLGIQEFASLSATEYLGIERVQWVVEIDDSIDDVGGIPMGAGMFGQVLINLYRNALAGIARGMESGFANGIASGVERGGDSAGTIRLRVMRLDGNCGVDGRSGVLVRVEDSGVGFDGDDVVSGGGYGLGLKVCRALCGQRGGRVEVGSSAMLGGGRVDVVFV